ncbi:DUF4232 domain-containing protein [Nakamurella leprariae]|uniref:DUF4232 domain-containing protein n=1 Tax=Nakamurella leprariae TaxID=2803911 RepID=A0A939C0Q8_9ACTN|nr:hypothetical protein [Nakamurella leprariae]MBM9466299.1 hypothetical protein [Nakamurella leprariae]
MMHPVGPESSRTYWMRRLLVVAAAVIVLIGVVWFLINRSAARSSGSSDPGSAAVAGSTSSRPSLTGVLATPPTTPTPTTPTPPTTPSTTETPSTTGSEAAPSTTETSAPPAADTTTVTDPAATTDPAAPAEPAASDAGQPTSDPAAAPTPEPPPADQPTAAPAPEPPAPSYDEQGRLLCADAMLSVVASSAQPQWAPGSQPVLGMTVTNTGGQACVRDLSGPLQVYTVLDANGGHVWSTADCFPGTGTDVRELAPGASAQFSVRWSGTTSTPGCTGDRVVVGPGAYSVVAAIGGLAGTPAGFTVG